MHTTHYASDFQHAFITASYSAEASCRGIAQAYLAVRVVSAFLANRIEESASLREVLDAVERVGQIAANKRLTSVMLDYETESHVRSAAGRACWGQVLTGGNRTGAGHPQLPQQDS